ncbi:MAG: hypothetical protein HY861_02085 [Chlamydiia bacterium]|nr:hypothetical protein [Chlamydiia bacterium]
MSHFELESASQKSPFCRLYSKSQDHLLLQIHVRELLSPAIVQMERPFPSIRRIADLFWEEHKIAFEIQCSPISPLEATTRKADYQKLGIEVVWLLDDRIFNRHHVRPAEEAMRKSPCYFFSFHRSKTPFFYDQLEALSGQRRIKTGSPLRIDLRAPCPIPSIEWPPHSLSQILTKASHSRIYFQGDLLHRFLHQSAQGGGIEFRLWKRLETAAKTKKPAWLQLLCRFNNSIRRLYFKALEAFLEFCE